MYCRNVFAHSSNQLFFYFISHRAFCCHIINYNSSFLPCTFYPLAKLQRYNPWSMGRSCTKVLMKLVSYCVSLTDLKLPLCKSNCFSRWYVSFNNLSVVINKDWNINCNTAYWVKRMRIWDMVNLTTHGKIKPGRNKFWFSSSFLKFRWFVLHDGINPKIYLYTIQPSLRATDYT